MAGITTTPYPDRAGRLVEAYKARNPRVLFFYLVVALILLVLAGGLAYQQLIRTDTYHESERIQNQRRVLIPGPRGNIYDREGRLLVGNRARFSVVLYLDELRGEFYTEFIRIRNAYRASGDKEVPTASQLRRIARFAVVNRYLAQINRAIGGTHTLDAEELNTHFFRQLLLPFTLIDNLSPEDYARILEQLPVNSPLQVYTTSARYYPYGAAAAHALGSVKVDEIEATEDFPGSDLRTFKVKGTAGRDGLEARFDAELQGEAGGTIYRVDPSGYRIEPPVEKRLPVPGRDLVSSLDIDLQLAADAALANTGYKSSVVALDARTGEILAIGSNPGYDLNETSPRISSAKYAEIDEAGGWLNRPIQGRYPPGSSFKVITALAGMRAGALAADTVVNCAGAYRVGNRVFACPNHPAFRGDVTLTYALEKSCNTFFYKTGLESTPDALAAEARRFGLGQRTGVELPHENAAVVPDPAWFERVRGMKWNPGNTANFAIGQGDLLVTPLQMAAFVASFARGQVHTQVTMLHDPNRPVQRSAPIGLPASDLAAIVHGMEQCVLTGSARTISLPRIRIPDLRIAGKTGTAQLPGSLTVGWFICFAPVENPQIAIAVAVEGDTPGEDAGGGAIASPVAHAILKKWWEKKSRPPAPRVTAPTGE